MKIGNKKYGFTYMWSLKKENKSTNITKRKQTHRNRDHTASCQRGWGGTVGTGEGNAVNDVISLQGDGRLLDFGQ